MQLMQAGLRREGVAWVTRPVHLQDLPRFRSAVLVNSITPGQPVVGIDNVPLEADPSLLAVLQRAYLRNQAQPIT
jgi:branched-subunit amino acid aminotransferase/4-amino-4-deoxychorismate lyase